MLRYHIGLLIMVDGGTLINKCLSVVCRMYRLSPPSPLLLSLPPSPVIIIASPCYHQCPLTCCLHRHAHPPPRLGRGRGMPRSLSSLPRPPPACYYHCYAPPPPPPRPYHLLVCYCWLHVTLLPCSIWSAPWYTLASTAYAGTAYTERYYIIRCFMHWLFTVCFTACGCFTHNRFIFYCTCLPVERVTLFLTNQLLCLQASTPTTNQSAACIVQSECCDFMCV